MGRTGSLLLDQFRRPVEGQPTAHRLPDSKSEHISSSSPTKSPGMALVVVTHRDSRLKIIIPFDAGTPEGELALRGSRLRLLLRMLGVLPSGFALFSAVESVISILVSLLVLRYVVMV